MNDTDRPRRLEGDGGAVLVEAAFAFPIFLYIMMGFVDLGMAVFQSVQASGSARDVARFAILYPSDSNATYRAKAVGHLEKTPPNLAVNVTCSPDCTAGSRVTATVSWRRTALTFAGGFIPSTVRSTATMTIVGAGEITGTTTTTTLPTTTTTQPTTTTTRATTTTSGTNPTTTTTAATTTTTRATTTTTRPTTTTTNSTTCLVQSLTVTQPLARSSAQNKLNTNMNVAVQTNGALGCSNMKIRFYVNPAGSATTTNLGGSSPNYSVSVGKNTYSGWTAGTHSIEVLAGSTVVHTSSFTVN